MHLITVAITMGAVRVMRDLQAAGQRRVERRQLGVGVGLRPSRAFYARINAYEVTVYFSG
jgi:hypothetical protein